MNADAPLSALDVLGSLRLEDGSAWAQTAQRWQVDDARAVLNTRRRAPRWHYWLRPRGASKTSDAAGVALSLLIAEAPPRSRSYCYAVDERQAALLLDALAGFAARSDLLGFVEIGARTVTCRETGATLSVESSDGASAYGSRPWLVICDELALWPDTANHDRLWASIISGLGKVRGSRLVVLSSAGAPSSPAHRRWEAACAGDHWRTSLVPGPSPWWSPEDIEAARRDLLPAEFDRLILCQWVEADDALATADDVAACTGTYRVLEPRRGVRYTMSLDIGTRRDSTVLAIGHVASSPAGRQVVVDRTLRWTGTRDAPVSLDEVEGALVACWRLYNKPRLLFDFHQAAQITERLKRAGISCEEYVFSTSGVNKLARALYGALRDRAIMLPDDPELLAELASVRLVETGPGLVRLDHRSGGHDDQAVTVAMLAASLLDLPTGELRFHITDRPLPRAQLVRPMTPTPEAPPRVVREGERPMPGGVRLGGRFAASARRAKGYQPPGRAGR